MDKTKTVSGTIRTLNTATTVNKTYPSYRAKPASGGSRDTGIAVNGAFTSIFTGLPVEVYSDATLLEAHYQAAITQAKLRIKAYKEVS